MAATGEEDLEYESDPEEAKQLLKMRRREASDDEEDAGDGDETERAPRRIDSRSVIESDGESDGQGAPAEYDDEELEIEEDLEEDEEVEDEEEVEVEVEAKVLEEEEEEYEAKGGKGRVQDVGEADAATEAAEAGISEKQWEDHGGRSVEDSTEFQDVNQVEEEKKENEPFAVPTAGAFYMHDDRFRNNAGGRHRRTLGGRKLWESKDDMKWGHDKFEEITLRERHYDEGTRNSRGHYRARGKNQGADRGYTRGNKSKALNNDAYNNNNQNQGPKSVRGRGPRRYEASKKNSSEAPRTPHKQSGKSIEKTLHTTSGRASLATSNLESDPVPSRKQVFASSLSVASPPFYPSGSSNKETILSQKRDLQAGSINRHIQVAVLDESFSVPQSNSNRRGKNVGDSFRMEKLNINDSIPPVTGRPSTSLHFPPSGSSSVTQPIQPRPQGRGPAPSGQMPFQQGAPYTQVGRASPPTQLHTLQRSPIQGRVQPSLQASGQQFGQGPGSGSRTSPPPKATFSKNSFEPGEESPPESSKSKTALVGKGQGNIQGSGRGSFLYGGPQIMGTPGNIGSGHGDQNFPAFLPVMPFGGQHPGGVGVPAVGMAFPGYVAQPNGMGNSEMTWLPVLAGAAGALGASYCSPYLALDGSYHSRPSGQISSSGPSSKENNATKPNNELKPTQRTEVGSDEVGQRQKNTRRYTEMSFCQ